MITKETYKRRLNLDVKQHPNFSVVSEKVKTDDNAKMLSGLRNVFSSINEILINNKSLRLESKKEGFNLKSSPFNNYVHESLTSLKDDILPNIYKLLKSLDEYSSSDKMLIEGYLYYILMKINKSLDTTYNEHWKRGKSYKNNISLPEDLRLIVDIEIRSATNIFDNYYKDSKFYHMGMGLGKTLFEVFDTEGGNKEKTPFDEEIIHYGNLRRLLEHAIFCDLDNSLDNFPSFTLYLCLEFEDNVNYQSK